MGVPGGVYRIVAGIDRDEERARTCARAVADLPGPPSERSVWLLHSFENNPEGASATQVGAVRDAREILEEAGVEVSVHESSGDPADALLALADEADADLVAVAGRRDRTPAGKALFGSTTQAVLLGAEIRVSTDC